PTGPRDARRADEHPGVIRIEGRLERVDLPSERVPRDVDVEEAPRRLVGIRDALREQDRARAGAEDRAAAGDERADRLFDARTVQEMKQGGRFAARNDERVERLDL